MIALENELLEAKTLAANPSSVELAALRSKSISLEAELELAKTDGAKSEEAMGGMLRMQRAMSSAQKAKITQLHEQNAALEAQITALKGQVQEARAAAEDADSSREELRREAERFESHVNEALDQKEAEWERANDTAVRRVQAELAQTKELTRKMLLAHAAAKLRWAAERASLIEEGASRSSVNSAAAFIGREARRAAETNAHGVDNRALASEAVASTAPGTALHALLAATTRRQPAEGATRMTLTDEDDQLVAELLRDAMEEEVAAAIERGYYVDDAAGGAVVVGANAIVEKIVAKYKSTEGGPDGGGVGAEKDREPEPVAEVRTPGHTPIDVDDAEDDTEEDTWWKERAVLVAELARARAATEVAEARAAVFAAKDSEVNEEESEFACGVRGGGGLRGRRARARRRGTGRAARSRARGPASAHGFPDAVAKRAGRDQRASGQDGGAQERVRHDSTAGEADDRVRDRVPALGRHRWDARGDG